MPNTKYKDYRKRKNNRERDVGAGRPFKLDIINRFVMYLDARTDIHRAG